MAGSGKKDISKKPRKKSGLLSSENILLILMVAAVVVGCIIGVLIKYFFGTVQKRYVKYIGFPGEIFLSMLKCLILPLIVSSIVNSLARLNASTAGRISWITCLYIGVTTFVAVIEGIVLVLLINPGRGQSKEAGEPITNCNTAPVDSLMDLVRNLFPSNIVEAVFRHKKSCLTSSANGTLLGVDVQTEEGMNILGLVTFAVAMGIVISLMAEDGIPLADFFLSLEGASMKLITAVIWYGPFGITFLIIQQIVAMDNIVQQLQNLGLYTITVLAAIAVHGIIILPLVYWIFVRKNPLKHIAGVTQAMVTALGTDSSSATLPVTIKCMEENNGCDHRITRFVLPLGATVNMNGTALYEAVAALYIAQVVGKPLGFGDIVLVSVTATLAGIGAASIPQAGLVTLLLVLVAVGLPPEYVSLIIPVDWFLDRFRTMCNVFGDTVGAAIVHKYCADQLAAEDAANLEEEEIPDDEEPHLRTLKSIPSVSQRIETKPDQYGRFNRAFEDTETTIKNGVFDTPV